jgi:hypothetical protein
MQTTNTVKTSSESIETSQRGPTVVKSLAGLAVAVLDSQIDKFALLVRQGIDTWRNAGKLLVEMTEKDPSAVARIKERSGLSDAMIQTFARIGRNEIWPSLLADSSMGAQKLLACHYEDQKKYASDPIEVAYEWRSGNIKTVKRKVSELSRQECAVVFSADGRINNLEQQSFRLRSPAPETKLADLDPRAEVKNAAVRMVNVDIGYFSVVQAPDGTVTCEPCGRSPIAQPVRVIPNGRGFKSAIVLYYKQEMK